MKTIAKNIMVVTTLLTAMVVSANDFGGKSKAKSEVETSVKSFDLDPTFKRKGNKLYMNLLNLSEGKVILKVLDGENRELFNEEVDGKLVVEKAFNFVKAERDTYTIIIVDVKGTYTETVSIY